MTIKELEKASMNCALAYIIGLIYPLYKEKSILGKEWILGCVNHNPGKITDIDLDNHFQAVRLLLDKYENTKTIKIYDNKQYKVQPKIGFSILIDKSGISTLESLNILTAKVKEIRAATIDVQKEFIKGCFDGRSSWDTTAHYLAIDVDRDYERQDLIVSIVENTGINLNVNNRGENHPKNDQLRIKPDCLEYFLSFIGMFSTYRVRQVSVGLGLSENSGPVRTYETEKELLATFREFDVINQAALNARFGIATTNTILSVLISKREFIEFEKGHFINNKKLRAVGVGEKQFFDFCERVYSDKINEAFFTAKSLMQEGCVSEELDELGFGEVFIASILKMDSRFKYSTIGEMVVFSIKKPIVTIADAVIEYVNSVKMVSIDEMINDFNRVYGIEIGRQTLLSKIKDSNIYHDTILDYLYRDYDTYYQDI